MEQTLYIVNATTKRLNAAVPVSFAEIGIKERGDLEQWVVNHPGVLGEPLLVITSEFDRFDRSSRRLDVLALDKHERLVIVELKLDLSATKAELQAVRYAAFCSTMQPDQIVQELARHDGISQEAAEQRILGFLEVEELPDFDKPPRIIIAGASLDDEELTSTVLWLRTFGVDITCVELAPFRMPDKQLVLVPRTIIPLPEAKDYIVRVEQKESARTRRSEKGDRLTAFFQRLADKFNALGTQFQTKPSLGQGHMKVYVGHSQVHYEWMPRKREKVLVVALHFEAPETRVNLRRLEPFKARRRLITAGETYPFSIGPWAAKWASADFRVPFDLDDEKDHDEVVAEAARLMSVLIDRTYPLVEKIKADKS